ncbi:MAG: ABC transporter ATP-binding protein [Rhodomicrobiaceae bacterium]
MSRPDENLLELEGITKSFPGVLANDDVSFRVGRGEIHALLGENGAGKSTLVKMIYGVLKPDSGTMRLHGEPFAPSRPSEARAHGIGMVFQHFSLFEALTVTENIELGINPELTKGDLRGRIIDVSERYGLKLDPDRRIGDLSVGQRQRVEIVRCLLQNPQLIIMDEPTSVLTPQEVDMLFATLRRLAEEGRSILYISHKLEEIRALCHHATILRGGKVIATCTPAEETAKSLAEMMIGAILMPPRREGGAVGQVRLRLDRLSLPTERPFGVDLREMSLDVRAAEIVGIAGVAGNGQEELMTALIGEHALKSPEALQFDGQAIGGRGPDERRALGMCFVPEERLGHAAVPNMTLIENTALSARIRKGLCRSGFINFQRTEEFSKEIVEKFNVRTAGVEHAARSLSGGNLQKFLVGREMLQAPSVLIASQPTWGVDAGAAAAIHQALIQLARDGAAILIISQDLDELMAICDRIAVISNGRLTEARPVEQLTIEGIGVDMGGQAEGSAAYA